MKRTVRAMFIESIFTSSTFMRHDWRDGRFHQCWLVRQGSHHETIDPLLAIKSVPSFSDKEWLSMNSNSSHSDCRPFQHSLTVLEISRSRTSVKTATSSLSIESFLSVIFHSVVFLTTDLWRDTAGSYRPRKYNFTANNEEYSTPLYSRDEPLEQSRSGSRTDR